MYPFRKYYEKYLKEIRKVSNSTIGHYIDAINSISKLLIQKNKIKNSLFEISDVNELEIIKEFLNQDVEFIQKDAKGHNMYSVGFNHYLKFATGEGFKSIDRQIKAMDEKMPVGEKSQHNISGWKKSSIIRSQVLEAVNYCCEINNEHITFTSKSTLHSYMEGHHIIPMKLQDKFDVSLDVYANVVSLCPTCHRLLHYGIDSDKRIVLKKLYYDRSERFAKSGILLNESEFENLVL